MATMRPFGPFTLEGNWMEDRLAKGSKGLVIPDLGFREYRTAASEAWLSPSERPEASKLGKPKLRVGMVTPDTLSEAAYSYGAGLPPQTKFDSTTTVAVGRGTLKSEEVSFPKSTTMREAMAGPTGFSETAAGRAASDNRHLFASAMAPPAGGSGSLRMDRGKKSLRKPGQPLVLGEAPPSYPTRETHRSPPEVVHDLAFMSLTVPSAASEAAGKAPEVVQMAPPGAPHGRFAAFSAAPRVVTAVTATTKELSMRPGRHVFADE